jgi:hypothetical protein
MHLGKAVGKTIVLPLLLGGSIGAGSSAQISYEISKPPPICDVLV